MLLLSRDAVLSQHHDRTLSHTHELPGYAPTPSRTIIATLWSALPKDRPIFTTDDSFAQRAQKKGFKRASRAEGATVVSVDGSRPEGVEGDVYLCHHLASRD
jgi:hypothetical protein